MSNVSTVTPYDSSIATNAGELADTAQRIASSSAIATDAIASVCQWLVEATDEDISAKESMEIDRKKDRVAPRQTQRLSRTASKRFQNIVSTGLHLQKPDTLIRTAEKLGYKVESRELLNTLKKKNAITFLRNPSGERLAIQQTQNRTLVHSRTDTLNVQKLVRVHTLNRTLDHLRAKGMTIKTTNLPTGETQILANETHVHGRDGAAEIKAQVSNQGTVLVDIDGLKGNRCERIVKGIAASFGGQITAMDKKSAFFQLPGETTKIKLKV